MKKRRPNIAKTLIQNSMSAMFSAIEIHNKPNFEYRYPVVVILILNSWELILKGYLYKNGYKSIINKNKDGRYPSLKSCIDTIFIGNDLLVFKENLHHIYEYRNLVVHAFCEELDEIIFSLIYKNIELYARFLSDFLGEDIVGYKNNLIILPIGFSKPFSPTKFLSQKNFSKSYSEEIVGFLKNIVISTENLNEKGVNETILVNFNVGMTTKNKVSNADFLISIEKGGFFPLRKETVVKYSDAPGVQQVRNYSVPEIEENFNIGYNDLIKGIQNKGNISYKRAQEFYRKIVNVNDKYAIFWSNHPINKKKFFHKDIFQKIEQELIDFCNGIKIKE